MWFTRSSSVRAAAERGHAERVVTYRAVGSVAVLAVVTVLAWVAGPVAALELAVAGWFETVQQPTFAVAMQALAALGRFEFLAALLGCVAVVTGWRTRSWIPVGQAAFTVLATNLLVSALKLLTARPAPAAGVPDLLAGGLSYPSGHLANSVATGGCLLAIVIGAARADPAPPDPRFTRCLRIAVVALPILVATGMLYLGYHWITDFLAGLAVGTLVDSTRAILTARVARDPAPARISA